MELGPETVNLKWKTYREMAVPRASSIPCVKSKKGVGWTDAFLVLCTFARVIS